MTRAQAERVIRAWQGRLGLERWSIEVCWDEPAADDENARTWRSAYYDDARMYFSAEWSKWSRERFEQIAVHELLHLCHRDMDEVWRDMEGQLHRDAWSLANLRYVQEMEGFIDRLSARLLEVGGPA